MFHIFSKARWDCVIIIYVMSRNKDYICSLNLFCRCFRMFFSWPSLVLCRAGHGLIAEAARHRSRRFFVLHISDHHTKPWLVFFFKPFENKFVKIIQNLHHPKLDWKKHAHKPPIREIVRKLSLKSCATSKTPTQKFGESSSFEIKPQGCTVKMPPTQQWCTWVFELHKLRLQQKLSHRRLGEVDAYPKKATTIGGTWGILGCSG